MEFFSGSKPNLVSNKLIHKFNKTVVAEPATGKTISEKVFTFTSYIYNNYIKEHKYLWLLVVVIAIFLGYRYYNRSNKSNKENYTCNANVIDEVEEAILNKLKFNKQPSFNPLKSVDDQKDKEPVNYPPEPIPIRTNGAIEEKTFNPYDVKPLSRMETPKYNYNNVYEEPSRNYYDGTYNTYKNAKDTTIVNPLGFSNKFNTTTGAFIGEMTNNNKHNVFDYQKILNDNRNNMVAGAQPHKMNPTEFFDPLNLPKPYAD